MPSPVWRIYPQQNMADIGAVAGLAAYLTNTSVGAATGTRAQLLVPCVHGWQGQLMVCSAPDSILTIVATVARYPQFLDVRRTRAVVATAEEVLAMLVWLIFDAFAPMRGEPVEMVPPPWRKSAEKLVTAIALLCGARVSMHPAHPEIWNVSIQGGKQRTIVFHLDHVSISADEQHSVFPLPALTTMHPRHSTLVSGCHCEPRIIKWAWQIFTQGRS